MDGRGIELDAGRVPGKRTLKESIPLAKVSHN